MSDKIRTDVEELYLQEMVKEDNTFMCLNDEDESIMDDIIDTKSSLFEDINDNNMFNILGGFNDNWLL